MSNKKSITERSSNALDDIYPSLYYAERMSTYFQEEFFGMDPEAFDRDEKAQKDFIYNYEKMGAQLYAISEMLFDMRLKAEFGLGLDTPITQAHIRNELEMQTGIKPEWGEIDEPS